MATTLTKDFYIHWMIPFYSMAKGMSINVNGDKNSKYPLKRPFQ
jgi:hypothetical protein